MNETTLGHAGWLFHSKNMPPEGSWSEGVTVMSKTKKGLFSVSGGKSESMKAPHRW